MTKMRLMSVLENTDLTLSISSSVVSPTTTKATRGWVGPYPITSTRSRTLRQWNSFFPPASASASIAPAPAISGATMAREDRDCCCCLGEEQAIRAMRANGQRQAASSKTRGFRMHWEGSIMPMGSRWSWMRLPLRTGFRRSLWSSGSTVVPPMGSDVLCFPIIAMRAGGLALLVQSVVLSGMVWSGCVERVVCRMLWMRRARGLCL
mmetsp:Transcript_7906/g.23308  ORF Transcript_7906/g.23308 Transcript_7906/m.23308 type:complete len:207 (-) Transcript_7906:217-837(-)